LREQIDLDQFEAVAVELRLSEPLPKGRLDAAHYLALHKHMFQDVYGWAGRARGVRIHKGNSTFCYPEHIARQLDQAFADLARQNHLRGLSRTDFAHAAAAFMAWLNHIHPFREGNGRTMNTFMALLAQQAGHELNVRRIVRTPYVAAMIASFQGNEQPLATLVESWITP
jgi:cell filamentation protein